MGYALLIAIALVIVFAILLRLFAREKQIDWWISLSSTLISVILGIVVALWFLDFTGNRESEEHRNRLRTILDLELSHTYRVLSDDGTRLAPLDSGVWLTRLDPSSITAASNSGLFSDSVTAALIRIAHKVRWYNTKADLWFQLVADGKEVRELEAIMEQDRIKLVDDISSASETLALPALDSLVGEYEPKQATPEE